MFEWWYVYEAYAPEVTPHLGERPHPVVASAAREVLNKSDNERSGVLSTAMSFLGLYRRRADPKGLERNASVKLFGRRSLLGRPAFGACDR